MSDVAWQRFPEVRPGPFDTTVEDVDPFGDGRPRTYEAATWVSPPVRPGFVLSELVPSWSADTPAGSWLRVEVRLTLTDGATTAWYVLARWTSGDAGPHRTTVPGQKDQHGQVATDTWVAAEGVRPVAWQVRATLLRPAGSAVTPAVRWVGAMASAVPAGPVPPSPHAGMVRVLDVPAYSQQVHRGQYPQWDNGGESWCSATSVAMVLDHWGAGPTAEETAWVDPGYADPQVCHAVREVFDNAYGGAGNWAFNAAYAGTRGLRAHVTRLRDLAEAERFIAAGIPLVASVSFTRDQLDGAGYDTAGHLLVIVGFDAAGHVVVNDPASHGLPDNGEVRTTYDREQFERAWGGSGGLVYVIHPPRTALPAATRPDQPSW